MASIDRLDWLSSFAPEEGRATLSRPLPIARGEYVVWSGNLAQLDVIRRRLYAPEPLTPDERRDLANKLDALLGVMLSEPIPDERI
jgi:hypothetical protein